jgi:hypothetical protein
MQSGHRKAQNQQLLAPRQGGEGRGNGHVKVVSTKGRNNSEGNGGVCEILGPRRLVKLKYGFESIASVQQH